LGGSFQSSGSGSVSGDTAGGVVASLFNALFGMLMAWILTRYRFPGRSLLDGLIDLPFELPTAVASLTLAGLVLSMTGVFRYQGQLYLVG